MSTQDRKAAVAAYKERKVESGIYVIQCTTSGQAWVGSAPDLSTIKNRIWFSLRQGGNTNRTLLEAWRIHGSDAFTFSIVDRLADDEEEGYFRDAALKSLRIKWTAKLNAVPM